MKKENLIIAIREIKVPSETGNSRRLKLTKLSKMPKWELINIYEQYKGKKIKQR